MNLLAPLGLLGLLSIVVLVLIYIIKPNYQQKFVSSTYIWKLSLKYKKRNIPVSRIRNLLIFICQILILSLCAVLLARAVIPTEKVSVTEEKVVIIDASASMLIAQNGETRFERAVEEAKNSAKDTADKEGLFSVIVADAKPKFLVQRARNVDLQDTLEKLDSLLADINVSCSYGSADLDEAAVLADEVIAENFDCQVWLYTATNYIDKGKYNVVDVSVDDEWNAAILNCQANIVDNYYQIVVDVGCFGKSDTLTVYCDVDNPNNRGENSSLHLEKTEVFDAQEQQKQVIFTMEDFGADPIFSFEKLYIHLEENDSFDFDNSYYVYGGVKQSVKIQFVSTEEACPFYPDVLRTIRETFKNQWSVEIKEVWQNGSYETEGFDFYVFEHSVPEQMPTDGVVMLIDPSQESLDSGLTLGSIVNVTDGKFSVGQPHALTNKTDFSEMIVTNYRQIVAHDGFTELLYCGNDPVLLVKNTAEQKVVVLALDVHNSDLSMILGFPLMMRNTFTYFFPATTNGNSFEIGDSVQLNMRGTSLKLSGPNTTKEFTEPSTFLLTLPGTYTLTQQSMRKNEQGVNIVLTDMFYVSVPNFESNITKEVDSLPLLHYNQTNVTQDYDLIIWLVAALVALLFAEWWLQSRDY